MSAVLGGFSIVNAGWIAPQTLAVQFTSIYSDRFHQLYLGRSLIGVTGSFAARLVTGIGKPSQYPEELQLVAVTAADRLTDFGASLPQRPYNRARLLFTTSGWAALGADSIEIVSGTAPGGAIVSTNVLTRIPFDVDRQYTFISDPLPGSGTWNFGVAGRDGTQPTGNRGTETDVAVSITSRPPDVLPASNGNRLTPAITAGALTVGFAYNF